MAERRDQIPESASAAHALDHTGWIRRVDVSLRSQYPNLVTRIFEIAHHQFRIVFDRSLQDAAQVDFDDFRPVTLQAAVSNDIPATFIREIPTILDNQLAHNFEGFPFNTNQLLNLVAGRFPDLPIAGVRDGGTPMTITIELNSTLEPAQEREVLDFCNGIGAPAPFRLEVTSRPTSSAENSPPRPPIGMDDVLFVRAFRVRPSAPSFVRADEAFWFSNLDRIYAGGLYVEQIPGIEEGDSRCFLDATIGEHVNLRQLLTLYDTIYMSPPLREGHEAFLAKQGLTENDILTLIERGRLRIISTQDEERLKGTSNNDDFVVGDPAAVA